MRTKFFGILTLLLALSVQLAFAQQKTVTGTVTDDSGLPLPGASVVEKGTSNGVSTDFDGNYSITVSQGAILQVSFVSYITQELVVGAGNVINVSMQSDNVLEEVVVTAQGIVREKKALGYAVSEVESEALEQRADADVARVLTGKASGVQILNQSGLAGSGTSVIIRGLSSFSGNNQPLFVVDGVPFSNDTNAGDDFVNGNFASSRFIDLDPNNIESINVLKGLSASTLYGTLGRNGVVLITTKNGSKKSPNKKFEASVTASSFFEEIASFPDYQDDYGNGFDQSFGWFFSNWGPAFRREGPDGWGNDGSGLIDSNGTVAHPYSTASFRAAFPEFQGVRYAYKAYDNEGFFRTGVTNSLNVNLGGSSSDGKYTFNGSIGNLDQTGFTPGNSLKRTNLGIGGKAELSNRFTVSGTLNFARTDVKTPPLAAGDGNTTFNNDFPSVFSNFFFTPRSVDLLNLPFSNPLNGSSVYYRQNNSIQHPLWTVANAQVRQETSRTFGTISLDYKFDDNLSLLYRLGLDMYSENNTNYQNKGGVSASALVASGYYETWNNTNYIWNHDFILSGRYELFDKLNSSFNAGLQLRRDVFDQNGVSSNGQVVFGVLRHFNFSNQNEIQEFRERNIVGMYGQFDIDYDGFIYLSLAGRNDWVSNLTTENNSIFYPSGSVSFIPTALFNNWTEGNALNYLKFRFGYGTSANFPTGYPVSQNLNLDVQRFTNGSTTTIINTTNTDLGNPDLKPELLSELELGVEGRFWDNRISFEGSVYQRTTTDLIIDRLLDASTGFTATQTNIGEIQAKGIELDGNFEVFRPENDGGFVWNFGGNWTKVEPIVKDLGADTDLIVYAGFSNLGNAAIKDRPLGVIVGSTIDTDDEGNYLVNNNGDYVINNDISEIGNPNPDWTLNIRNNLGFANFNFYFLFTYQHGGDIYSQTTATLLGRGLIKETANRRETYILPGVNQDSGLPNTRQINNSTYFFNNILFGPNELQVYDGSVMRLQEVSLSYGLPKKFLDRTPFGGLTFTASGFNLWYDAINTPDGANFDPNVAGVGVGNGAGFDFLNGPSARRFGFSVKATF